MTTLEHVHLATPRATPGRSVANTPPKIAGSIPTLRARKQDLDSDSDDQDNSMTTDDQCGLTERDPLSRYLTAESRPRSTSPKSSPENIDADMLGEEDEAESEHFHDAPSGLETDDDTINSLQISEHALSHQYNDVNDSTTDYASPMNSGNKRPRHWELSPSQRLLHTVEPHPSKRIALSISPSGSHGADGIASCGLLRPRSFSPSLSPAPSIWVTPPTDHNAEHADRAGSGGASALSEHPWVASASTFWRKQDWKVLEDLYDELNGENMTEPELGQVVDRFLAKQEVPAEEKPKWSREFVLLRCVALHRVRVHETPDAASQELYSPTMSSRTRSWRGSSPGFGNRIGATRRSVSPYPVALTRRAGSTLAWSSASGSPRSIADFVDERRADRARQQRTADQGYQIKSVFKHRFAAGLKTVGELLPFWKDVEMGHTDVKEEVVVPLVPAGRAHSVIEAFESQAAVQAQLGRQHSLPARSRSGSVLSTTGGWNRESIGRSVSPAPSSIAEMISRGHAARAASASASVSAAATTSTPPTSDPLTQTSD
ncbi:hypothetical protein BGZ96_006819 [Linnemannia gamsii]|uniref:Uncharacterized protein n=1 Tax=Linnemannia gamsii TaxID=64522 RepID=A0ABQ7K227_9FUNG|nr:hypothetical protein BGZ96_006819 [Linnemannia gamsii]